MRASAGLLNGGRADKTDCLDRQMHMVDFPIDLVVTYVDDRDPVWQKAI